MAAAVLDRVVDHMATAQEELIVALRHFGDGNLHQSSLALRQARDRINRSMATIRNRGRS